MKWLQDLLKGIGVPDEMIAKIKESDVKAIPKERFDEVNTSLKDAKEELKTRDTQLKEVAKKAEGNEDLQAKIKELEATNKQTASEFQTKIRNTQLDNAISNKLRDSKAKHPDLLASKFDREKLKVLEDGTIEGLDSQFTSVQETYKDMFTQELKGATPPNPDTQPSNTDAFLKGFNEL